MSMYPEQIHRMTTASMLREWREHGGKSVSYTHLTLPTKRIV